MRAASSYEKVRKPSKAFVSLVGSESALADSGRWRLHSVRIVKLVLGVSPSEFSNARAIAIIATGKPFAGHAGLKASRCSPAVRAKPAAVKGHLEPAGAAVPGSTTQVAGLAEARIGCGERSLQLQVRQEMSGGFVLRFGFLSGHQVGCPCGRSSRRTRFLRFTLPNMRVTV